MLRGRSSSPPGFRWLTVPLNAVCAVKGIVSTGGAEDRELLVPFETAAALAGTSDSASVIEIRAPGDRVESIRAALAAQFPAADVRTISPSSTPNPMSSSSSAPRSSCSDLLIILGITVLCVCGNFSEMVLERSKEIGILKALGGAERRIAGFFVSESALLAVAATVVGYARRHLRAAAIGKRDFRRSAFSVQISGWYSSLSPPLCWPLPAVATPSPPRASGASSLPLS